MLRDEDRIAIEEGVNPAEDIVAKVLKEFVITEDFIAQHTLKCLSWLLRSKRVEIKIALMKNALFHPKVWLFSEDDNVVAAHGSSNMTYAGIQKNIEQISVSKSWEDENQSFTTNRFYEEFTQLWADEDEFCTVIPMPKAIEENILKTYYSDNPPTESDLQTLQEKTTNTIEEFESTYSIDNLPKSSFTIPPHLNYETGHFEHQGKAVNAWCDNGFQGILEMATGSGKTITAMICAHRLYHEQKPLLVVVAAPYIPLIQQWCDEISLFGIKPINFSISKGPKQRSVELYKLKKRLLLGISDVEFVVVTHRTLCSKEFKTELEQFECETFLIADEVHNLGSEGFISAPPKFFDYRLGLSATPVRQYDEEGTEELFSFFGSIVFQFTLKEAIGLCLVGYKYYVHKVELTEDEMEQWYEITERIKKNIWRQEDNDTDDFLTKLLIKRKAILENAVNKIAKLREVLVNEDYQKLKHTLIYTTDKAPQQLIDVNELLYDQGIIFHPLTAKQMVNRKKVEQIIESFKEGNHQILTAKRVLDEGVNIPQIEKAFILASTTVERQWVQRRGRLLRKCKETNKEYSVIHDFIALPPDLVNLDKTARTMIKSELERIKAFANLAMNNGDPDGPWDLIDELIEIVYF